MAKLLELLFQIEGSLQELERHRSASALANDVYEAASYWANLGRWVLDGNTAVDFPARALDEGELLRRLVELSKTRPLEEQVRYAPTFTVAEELLAIVSSTVPTEEGHLRFLKIVGGLFRFVEESYGFKVVASQPILLRYSSGVVYLNLECSKNTSISCSFGPEVNPHKSFWIDDLLFMYSDARYRSIPQTIDLSTSKEVEEWFGFVAEILRQHGHSLFSDEPGIFDRLERAQDRRDTEYISEMDRRYGEVGPS